MNIFAVSSDVKFCAQYLDSKRLNKMILESAQLLSIYCRKELKSSNDKLYKGERYSSHPAYKWMIEDELNVKWLYRLFQAYCLEWFLRKDKIHGCHVYDNEILSTEFTLYCGKAIPSNFVNITNYPELDTHQAYRLYLADKWRDDINKGRIPKFN